MNKQRAWFRLVAGSLIGIITFFVKVPLADNSKIPVDYVIGFFKENLHTIYHWIMMFLSVGCVIYHSLQKNKTSPLASIVQAGLSIIFITSMMLGIGSEAWLNAVQGSVNATGNIICAIFVSSFFMPFLLEYGLMEAMGVICRPMMRKVFLTPGTSAIIGVSAFLGNYSMGHVASRQMYEEGKFTEKEMVIVAAGFSTCSIGLMLNLANYLDIMEYWNLYVLLVMIVTFTVTIFVSRIPPICRKSDACFQGKPTVLEEKYTGNLIRDALSSGLEQAENAPSFYNVEKQIFQRIVPVIMEVASASIVIITFGSLLANDTDILKWLGIIYRPILQLFPFSLTEIDALVTGIGVSVIEPVMAGIVCDAEQLSIIARMVLAVVPYSAIIFFAGFIPSIHSSKIPMKLWELLVLWIERALSSLLVLWILLPVITVLF